MQMKTPITISNEDWNKLYMPQTREKKEGYREGVPEHKAAALPSGPGQVWTVSYKEFIEVIAPTYMKAVELAELATGYDRSRLLVEMGEKQKDFPKSYVSEGYGFNKSKNGNHQSESNNRGLEGPSLSRPKVQRSAKPRKNKIRSRSHSKSR